MTDKEFEEFKDLVNGMKLRPPDKKWQDNEYTALQARWESQEEERLAGYIALYKKAVAELERLRDQSQQEKLDIAIEALEYIAGQDAWNYSGDKSMSTHAVKTLEKINGPNRDNPPPAA